MRLYPLKFFPVYKDYPWGNHVLPERFGREAPVGVYAESWEVSTHPDGVSVVANGDYAGLLFSDLLAKDSGAFLGSAVAGSDFPLLLKIIDAGKPLSVQVHPNDSNEAQVGGEAKTEMWYFLNKEPSKVFCGLMPGTTPADFNQAMEEKHFSDVLRPVLALRGGATYVPGGRVHSIDAGCLIYEVQQRSNTTYRVYDWDRVDSNGNSRELHVDKALQVIDFDDVEDPQCHKSNKSLFVSNVCTSPYFMLDEIALMEELFVEQSGASFHVLFSADHDFEIVYGEGNIEYVSRGTSVFVPAALGDYYLRSERMCVILKTSVPES